MSNRLRWAVLSAVAIVLMIASCLYFYTQAIIRAREVLLPPQDVVGRDISALPRYPGSVRLEWGENKEFGTERAVYGTLDGWKTVVGFYFKCLPRKGWVHTSSLDWNTYVFESKGYRIELILRAERGAVTEFWISRYPLSLRARGSAGKE